MKRFCLFITIVMAVALLAGCAGSSSSSVQGVISTPGSAQSSGMLSFKFMFGTSTHYTTYHVYRQNGGVYLSAKEFNNDELQLDVGYEATEDVFVNLQGIMEQYDMANWNGYNEVYASSAQNNPVVFTLEVNYENGESIAAAGGPPPPNYQEAQAAINDYVQAYMVEHY